jgi:molybdopterin molybdotransferase
MSKISYLEAINKIQSLTIKSSTKKVFLSDGLGKILACDIKASVNSPAYPTAAMDGYAIKLKDNENIEAFDIIDYSPAGSIVSSEVSKTTCIKTFTGSLMPNGSDTLVPIENVELKENKVYIKQKVPCGFAVMKVGENYTKDEILIPKGTKIDFAEIGVMASLNIVFVEVYESPKIAICATGSEILDLGEEKQNESQIRSSNHLTVEAIAKKYGCDTLQLGLVKDDRESILKAFENGLNTSDILVTTGGVSVGDYDFVKDIVMDKLGATVVFKGVEIKPGQHVIVAQVGNKFICSLPGFAYSSTVCFVLFCLPIVFGFRGNNEKLNIVKAIAKSEYKNSTSKTVFTASNLKFVDTRYEIDTFNKKSGTSAILTNLLGNSALAIMEPNMSYKIGDVINTIVL